MGKLQRSLRGRVTCAGGIAIAVATLGCASAGALPGFPLSAADTESASVTVLRNRNIFGSVATVKLRLDGYPIANLGTGQHISFYVPPGTHAIGISETSLSLDFAAGAEYFFEINVSRTMQFELDRLSPDVAVDRLRDSVDLTPQVVQKRERHERL